jgi:hypothetical protein
VKALRFGSAWGLCALAALVAGCSGDTSASTSTTTATKTTASFTTVLPVVAVPGYTVSVFTEPNSSANVKVSNPDSAVIDQGHVFIDYQNVTAKDGSDGKKSTVVEYDMQGKFLKSWDVMGHSDGMRADPATHLIWTTSNEDGNPVMATIDPAAGTVTPYTFDATPHGGGYDDVYFLGGKTYIAASAPNLDSAGNNPFPAVDQISLSGGKVTLTPVLTGNASAFDTIAKAQTTLTLTDPDSLSTNTNGDLVLVDQADSQYITISAPGTATQKVTVTKVGDQLDDTVWGTGAGRLLVVDASGFTYWIGGPLVTAGVIYTQAPNDSGVTNFVATIDPATGFVTPIAIGFTKATGMLFVPNA